MSTHEQPGGIYRFQEFELDADAHVLRRHGTEIALPGLSYRLLLALVKAAPGMLSHDELIEHVWAGRIVSPETITQRVKLLRKALGDDAQHPEYVGLVRGEGYRLLAPVERIVPPTAEDKTAAAANSDGIRPPWRVALVAGAAIIAGIAVFLLSSRGVPENSVAVLPFAVGTDDEQAALIARSLGDDLRNELGRVRGVSVAAGASSEAIVTASEETTSVRQMGERLNVAVIVEGSVSRQSDDTLLISLEAVDTDSGYLRWSKTYVRSTSDLIAVRRDIAIDVARQFVPTDIAESDVGKTQTSSLSAYEHVVLGHDFERQVRDQPEIDPGILSQAIDHYGEAVRLDPQYAEAWGRLGTMLLFRGDLEEAERAVTQALGIDAESPGAYLTLGTLRWLRNQDGSGEAWAKAVELNPNNPDALQAFAWWNWHQGDGITPKSLYAKALELDPLSLSRYSDYASFLGRSGRRDEALQVIEAIRRNFSGAAAHATIAEMLELAGEVDDAIVEAFKARQIEPDNPSHDWLVAELFARLGNFEAAARYEPDPGVNLLYRMRRYPELIATGRRILQRRPGDSNARYLLAFALNATGQFEASADVLKVGGLPGEALHDTRVAPDEQALLMYADALSRLGRQEEADEYSQWIVNFMDRLIDTGHSTWWPFALKACAHALLGETASAAEALRHIVQSPRLPEPAFLQDAPCFTGVRQLPEFGQAIESIREKQRMLSTRLAGKLEADTSIVSDGEL